MGKAPRFNGLRKQTRLPVLSLHSCEEALGLSCWNRLEVNRRLFSRTLLGSHVLRLDAQTGN
jgi:hypothetical protein